MFLESYSELLYTCDSLDYETTKSFCKRFEQDRKESVVGCLSQSKVEGQVCCDTDPEPCAEPNECVPAQDCPADNVLTSFTCGTSTELCCDVS